MEFYYVPDFSPEFVDLSPEEARHCVKVIRHVVGDLIVMVDGKGCRAKGTIVAISKERCQVQVEERETVKNQRDFSLHIAVAPTKNRERIEWFVEKAVEIGIEKITFLLCDHSERPRMDMLRMERIAVSAMKQSQSTTIPEMQIISFNELVEQEKNTDSDKMIAWCEASAESEELATRNLLKNDILLLIGPECDFSLREIELARKSGFSEVRLGLRRLRTETAALYGCCLVVGKKLGDRSWKIGVGG
ncbi:MAG: 16S rRNA (uracil(1498)-N(3))-methyltransferase [Bacteroidales bacterium]|jgi:16S rRNA (uracil1498-N3)-methyltransferase|nr:16S rRNA (uracil(1498)-N(3))-methyltransferase [Bacteroidales bacterium]